MPLEPLVRSGRPGGSFSRWELGTGSLGKIFPLMELYLALEQGSGAVTIPAGLCKSGRWGSQGCGLVMVLGW